MTSLGNLRIAGQCIGGKGFISSGTNQTASDQQALAVNRQAPTNNKKKLHRDGE